MSRIQQKLLAWYDANARDLPWRRTRDPYAVLVSEVMLQQTQVDRVIPYYQHFVTRFPTVRELAEAPTAEVIRIWSGLGYNRRAVNLQRAARMVVDELGGRFPRDPDDLLRLPGVGPYTAGAIAAFAFERDVAFLDTNMRRVVGRLTLGADAPGPHAEHTLLATARELVPMGHGWSWNQALIEFGALQCTAKTPACIVCPLQAECVALPMMQSALAEGRTTRRSQRGERFETSARYYRGRVVEVLRTLPENSEHGLDLAELGPRVRDGFNPRDLPWLREIVEGLQRDGLAVIMEEPPHYNAGASLDGSTAKVRLP